MPEHTAADDRDDDGRSGLLIFLDDTTCGGLVIRPIFAVDGKCGRSKL
jgi:hypothetical protein